MNKEYSCIIYKNKISINENKNIDEFILPNGRNYEEILHKGLEIALDLI